MISLEHAHKVGRSPGLAAAAAVLTLTALGLAAPASTLAAVTTCPSKTLVDSALGVKAASVSDAVTGSSASTEGSTPSMELSKNCFYGPVEISFSPKSPTLATLKDLEGDARHDFSGVKTVSGLGGGAFRVTLSGGAPYLYVLAGGKAVFEIQGSKTVLNATNEVALAKKLLTLKTL